MAYSRNERPKRSALAVDKELTIPLPQPLSTLLPQPPMDRNALIPYSNEKDIASGFGRTG